MTSNSLILVGDHSQQSEDGTLIRCGVGLTVAQFLQVGGEGVAWALNTGYSGPNVPKQRIQDFFSEAERRERALDRLYNADRDNLTKQHKQLLKSCHDLLKYALPKSTVATQLITFKILVAMITRYPGIRCLFHNLKSSKKASPPLGTSHFQDLWNRPEPCGVEWSFYRDFAVYCLGDSGTPTKLVESELLSKFGQLKSLEDNLNKDPIETLLSFCSADSQWDHEKLCAIRYLASILELPKFWRPQIKEGIDTEKRLLDFLSCLCETIIQLIRDTEPRSVDDSEVDLSPLWTSARGAVDILAFATFTGFLELHCLDKKLSSCPSRLGSIVSLLKRPEMERNFPKAYRCAPQVDEILNWQQNAAPMPTAISRNIIIFGQTGAGKSSLINLLAGSTLAPVSSGQVGATTSSKPYAITAPPKTTGNPETYTFWDTPGLHEGEHGTVLPREALNHLLELTRQEGTNLVVYCVRAGRLPDIFRVNFHSYWRIICDEKVPIILVVTGIEQEDNPNDWWKRNVKQFEKWKMVFSGHACVTMTRGRNNILDNEYQRSKQEVWDLVRKHCADTPYSPHQSEDILKKLDLYLSMDTAESGCIIF